MHPAAAPDHAHRTSASPRIIVVIPARYHSSRLPGKALAEIAGHPMIEHVYRRAAAVRGIDGVIVATDDERIASAVARFGGVACMTSTAHRTGTDRIAEAVRDIACDIVINVQGDEPLIEPAMIEQVLQPFHAGDVVMTTLRRAITDPAEIASPHVVKVVVDGNDDALYFSRLPIPFVRDGKIGPRAEADAPTFFKHIGLYGYRRDFLLAYTKLTPTVLERAESLEQLRALEHGFRIRTPETRFDCIGVDTPDDLERVRRQLHVLPAGARM